MRRSILPLPLSKVKPVPPPFEFIALAAAKVDPFGARGSEQCAGEPQARICAGGGDVTRVSILEPAFAAVHESAVGTAPTICSSARRSAVCRTSQRHPMSASIRNRRISLVPVRLSEGPLTEPTPAAQPSRREPLFMPRSSHSESLKNRLMGCNCSDATRSLRANSNGGYRSREFLVQACSEAALFHSR